MSRGGQALVEFALVTPILLGLFLGGADVAYLYLRNGLAQRAVQNVADRAAITLDVSPAGDPFVADEADRAGCLTFDYSLGFPDGGHAPGDRVSAGLGCSFDDLFGPRTLDVAATAVVPMDDTPSASPSP